MSHAMLLVDDEEDEEDMARGTSRTKHSTIQSSSSSMKNDRLN